MAKRPLIRKGDRTTHGGTVLAGDPTFLIDGRELARVGDPVSCPQCKGSHVIVTGAPDVLSGQIAARQDDVTDCGAKLIASQFTATWSDVRSSTTDTVASSESVQEADQQIENDDDTPRAIRFQAIDPDTGEPMPKCVYVLTREDGSQHGGLTNAQGFTETIQSSNPERVAVHFQFRSPKGQTVEREDLT